MDAKRFLAGTCAAAIAAAALVAAAAPGSGRSASVVLPPGNAVEQWNKIAEDTVVGSGAFQGEGEILGGLEALLGLLLQAAAHNALESRRDGMVHLVEFRRMRKRGLRGRAHQARQGDENHRSRR